MSKSTRPIQGLGEVALRVTDLEAMQSFYESIIGLRLMKRFAKSAFFRIADGHAGHTQILALFDRSEESAYCGLDADRTTVDHIAFAISLADFDGELQRLTRLGLKVDTTVHEWVHWRSLYVRDPEGNLVELVCYDPAV